MPTPPDTPQHHEQERGIPISLQELIDVVNQAARLDDHERRISSLEAAVPKIQEHLTAQDRHLSKQDADTERIERKLDGNLQEMATKSDALHEEMRAGFAKQEIASQAYVGHLAFVAGEMTKEAARRQRRADIGLLFDTVAVRLETGLFLTAGGLTLFVLEHPLHGHFDPALVPWWVVSLLIFTAFNLVVGFRKLHHREAPELPEGEKPEQHQQQIGGTHR